MIKGYKITQVVLHDWPEAPETELIVHAPAGCPACQEAGETQPHHELCGLIPSVLRDEPVYCRFEQGWGWMLTWHGSMEAVDEFIGGREVDVTAVGDEMERRVYW